jgi:aspartate/methionine/tyrosine aminotransferase
MDEFYGGYNYTSNCDGTTISSAENIEDVDEDDVLIIDGLTKRFRLPGWRIAWIVGPKEFIKAIGSCGSYLDGGANVPFQEAAVAMLEPDKVLNEMKALQRHFMVCALSFLFAITPSHKSILNMNESRKNATM